MTTQNRSGHSNEFPEDYIGPVSWLNPITGRFEPCNGDTRLVLWAFNNLVVDSRMDTRLIPGKEAFYNSWEVTIEELRKEYGPDVYTCLRGRIICLKWFNTLYDGYLHSLYVILPGEWFGVYNNGDHDFSSGQEARTAAEKYFQSLWDRENQNGNAGEIICLASDN